MAGCLRCNASTYGLRKPRYCASTSILCSRLGVYTPRLTPIIRRDPNLPRKSSKGTCTRVHREEFGPCADLEWFYSTLAMENVPSQALL